MPRRRTLRLLTALAACCAAGATLPSAFAAGGLSVTPALVEHTAAAGSVGSVVVSNTATAPLRITVTPRPWVQARSGGAVSPNRSRTLLSSVKVSARSFVLGAGAKRTVALGLLRTPSSGSLFGALEVRGVPTSKPSGSGITAEYRLIGSLRLTPASPRRRATVGTARVSGKYAVVAVRNTGNTVDPITGTARISGPRGTVNATIGAVRILPGAIVDLRLVAATKLPKGSYTATVSLTQGGKKITSAKRSFRR